ncbi:MAG: hypothetical protein M0P95_08025 [Sulfuritalea sp.]|jgi:hypothetical protein|nr:hypothetical protein [Sulfuritalea sp.]
MLRGTSWPDWNTNKIADATLLHFSCCTVVRCLCLLALGGLSFFKPAAGEL